MNKLYFEYYVPSISCCILVLFLVVVLYTLLSCCTLPLQLHIFSFFVSCCVYMSFNNIVITMGGQLR